MKNNSRPAFFTAQSTLFLLVVFLLVVNYLPGQVQQNYFDGPYIFQRQDSIQLQWVERGLAHDTTIATAQATVFERDSLPRVDLRQLNFPVDDQTSYKKVSKIAAISDIHGQYGIMHQLLLANGIIDAKDNWTYGDGHLVIVGDNFDRGDQVLNILWFLFHLEQKALAAGGKVHLLLGNHEMMVLQADLRYINKKYYYTSALFTTPYQQFFRKGSVLGDWIAQHKVMVSINKNLFVHAGISPAFLALGYSKKKTNAVFRDRIIRQPETSILSDPTLAALYGGEGPLWYRGYFDSTFTLAQVEKILLNMGVNSIVVGHTSLDEINPLFEGKIMGIDCSIKLGKDGQMLLIEDGHFYTVDLEGDKLKIAAIDQRKERSLFDSLYHVAGLPRLQLETDFNQLLNQKLTEEYQPASVTFTDTLNQCLLQAACRLRTRGKMRKEVCFFPPLLIDFNKATLDSLGYKSRDKLKLVIPCSSANYHQSNLYKEFLAYELYSVVERNSLRVRQLAISIPTKGGKEEAHVGFLVETEADYAKRKNATVLERGIVAASSLDRISFVRLQFFEYMIANTDWSLRNLHNLEIVKLAEMDKPMALAYDFDYSGFVGQGYAVPHSSLPISSVNERYFFSYPVTEKEFDDTVAYFLEIEEELYTTCMEATYLDEKDREKASNYLASFYEILDKPERFKRSVTIVEE